MTCATCPHLTPETAGHALRVCSLHDTPVSMQSWCLAGVYRAAMLALTNGETT